MYSDIRRKMETLFPKYYKYKCQEVDSFDFEATYEFININKLEGKDVLLFEYLRMLQRFSEEFIDSFCFSNAANRISNEIEEDGVKLLWEKYYRDREIRYLIPKYFYFTEYLSMMFYEILECNLINDEIDIENFNNNPRKITYQEILKYFKNDIKKENYEIINDDLIEMKRILKTLINFEKTTLKTINNYRNIITHRYMPGIDEIMVGVNRSNFRKKVKNHQVMYSIQKNNSITYEFSGGAEFKYEELQSIVKQMIDNMNDALLSVFNLKISENVIKKITDV